MPQVNEVSWSFFSMSLMILVFLFIASMSFTLKTLSHLSSDYSLSLFNFNFFI